jgi:hypothetical protein
MSLAHDSMTNLHAFLLSGAESLLAQSPIRQSQDTKKLRRNYVASFVFPSVVFFVSVSLLAKGRRTYRVAAYFERVEGTPFLFVSSFYLPTYLQSYVAHTYTY